MARKDSYISSNNLCCSNSPKMQSHLCRILQKCAALKKRIRHTFIDIFEESNQHSQQLNKKQRELVLTTLRLRTHVIDDVYFIFVQDNILQLSTSFVLMKFVIEKVQSNFSPSIWCVAELSILYLVVTKQLIWLSVLLSCFVTFMMVGSDAFFKRIRNLQMVGALNFAFCIFWSC